MVFSIGGYFVFKIKYKYNALWDKKYLM
jgi:hypothetical protein